MLRPEARGPPTKPGAENNFGTGGKHIIQPGVIRKVSCQLIPDVVKGIVCDGFLPPLEIAADFMRYKIENLQAPCIVDCYQYQNVERNFFLLKSLPLFTFQVK